VHYSDRDDNGCADAEGQEVWAKTAGDRFCAVVPSGDGTGYLVTRYDVNGMYTREVTSDQPGFDNNPNAVVPASAGWTEFLTALTAGADAATKSYEFDYHNECDDHWRDSFYGGSFAGSGTIRNCPRSGIQAAQHHPTARFGGPSAFQPVP
jgi:hypothetical protein